MNLVLITSVINISNNPLSYTNTRSFCSSTDRFNDTKKTINSVKKLIKNSLIFLIECSNINKEYENYFLENTDYYINLYNNKTILDRCNDKSKSMGEGTMTIEAFKYIFENKIKYDNFFKISGRYWLNEDYDYSIYDNNNIVVKKNENDINNICTCYYKLPQNLISYFYIFLLNSEKDFLNCVGYEIIFGKFINSLKEEITFVNQIGLNGFVSIDGSFVKL